MDVKDKNSILRRNGDFSVSNKTFPDYTSDRFVLVFRDDKIEMAERPEDLNLPTSIVTKIIKDCLPGSCKVSKEANAAIAKVILSSQNISKILAFLFAGCKCFCSVCNLLC